MAALEKIVRINSRGQFVLPIEFRNKLGLVKDSEVQVKLMKDGAIEIRPVTHVPKSFLLENSDRLREKILAAHDQVKSGKIADDREVDALLEEK